MSNKEPTQLDLDSILHHSPSLNTKIDEQKRVIDVLKSEIARGVLKPGQRLVENQLSEKFGIKRHLARDILRKLAQNHFVSIVPNVGAFVSELSQKDVEQIYDLEAVLEGLAARLVASFVLYAQLSATPLEELMDEMDSVEDLALFSDLNNRFHSILISLSGNKRLVELTSDLRQYLHFYGFVSFLSPNQVRISRAEHRKIFEAIKEANPDLAETLMRSHILDAKNRLVKYLHKSL